MEKCDVDEAMILSQFSKINILLFEKQHKLYKQNQLKLKPKSNISLT